jgi:SAM-dependent methyltransferase
MKRIENREYARRGDRVCEGGDMYESQKKFREFAATRDVGLLEQRALEYSCPKAHMDKWDGEVFIEALLLSPNKSVLEIGVGTGRLTMLVCDKCRHFTGIDISQKTVQRAAIRRVASLLKPSGRFVLSIDNNQQAEIYYGNRRITVYPDTLEEITTLIVEAGLTIGKWFETEFAVIFVATKEV